MENVIEIQNLNLFYDFGKKRALFDITFNIPENSVVAIIGPSGCGKSSFLRCINRMNDLVEGATVTGNMIFEGANIYGEKKKPTSEDIKQLNKLKNELTKYRISKKRFIKVANKKNSNSKEIMIHINNEMKQLIKQTKEQKVKLKQQHKSNMAEIIQKINKIKDTNKKSFLIGYFSNYTKIIKKIPKSIQTDDYLSILKLLKRMKDEKKEYWSKIKQIKNHHVRKIMEIQNYKQECIDNDINQMIKLHFESTSSEYKKLFKAYERQYRKVKGWKPDEVRGKIGLVFQKPNPFAKSIFENVAFGLRIHGVTDPWIVYTAVEKALKDAALWVEVKDRLNESALSLSGGQQQRLCIARAIALKPKVLLMDEPTASLDPSATKRIEELIRELRNKYTIIIVTHSMQQAARISDKTAFFYEGRLIEFAKTQDIFRNPKFEKTKQYITGDFG